MPDSTYVMPGDRFVNDDGNIVTICHDPDCESPRNSIDHTSCFYTWLRGRISPDAAPTLPELAEEYLDNEDASLADIITLMNDSLHYVALPVSIYEHGSAVYRTGTPNQFPDARFDAGYAGIIFEPGDYRNDDERARIAHALSDEVKLWSDWANGDCFGYTIETESGDELDSCWGFIGCNAEKSGLAECAGNLAMSA